MQRTVADYLAWCVPATPDGPWWTAVNLIPAKSRAAAGISKAMGLKAGTPLAVEEDRAAEAEFQRLNILHGGQVTSNRFRTQAGLTRAGGAAARTRSRTTAGAPPNS